MAGRKRAQRVRERQEVAVGLAAFRTAGAAIGYEGMVSHDLRHTANTLAADAGASRATLRARRGHADPKVSTIYLHTSRTHDRELAAALMRMAKSRG